MPHNHVNQTPTTLTKSGLTKNIIAMSLLAMGVAEICWQKDEIASFLKKPAVQAYFQDIKAANKMSGATACPYQEAYSCP